MDQDRQIRFAISPFFLFASLLLGAYLNHRDFSPIVKPEAVKELFGLLAATAVLIVPVGFLISAISVAFLRFLAFICTTPTYEAKLSDTTFDRIWTQVRTTQPQDKKLTLFAAVTFDHELLAKNVHTWLMRRWNNFNVASHSIVALGLAHLAAPLFKIPQDLRWCGITLAVVILLFLTAWTSWHETMKMVEFQSFRNQKPTPTQD